MNTSVRRKSRSVLLFPNASDLRTACPSCRKASCVNPSAISRHAGNSTIQSRMARVNTTKSCSTGCSDDDVSPKMNGIARIRMAANRTSRRNRRIASSKCPSKSASLRKPRRISRYPMISGNRSKTPTNGSNRNTAPATIQPSPNAPSRLLFFIRTPPLPVPGAGYRLSGNLYFILFPFRRVRRDSSR